MQSKQLTGRPERVLSVMAFLLGLLHIVQTYWYHFQPFNVLWIAEAVLLPAVVALGGYCVLKAVRGGTRMPPETLCAAALATLALVSVLASLRWDGDIYFSYNRVMLIDVAIDLLVMLPLPLLARRNGLGWLALMTARILAAVVSLWTLWLLIEVFLHQQTTAFGSAVGMLNGKNLTVVFHYNTVASFFSTLLMVCVLFAFRARHMAERIGWIAAALVNNVALVLTQSRTCILACIGALALTALMLVEANGRPWKALTRHLLGLAAAAVTAVALYLFQKVVFSLLHACWAANGIETADASGVRSVGVDANVTGRFLLWKAALQAMVTGKRYFLFGSSPNGVISRITSFYLLARGGYYTHNQFLEIGVAYGVPALLVYIVYCVLTARSCLRILFAGRDRVTPAERFVPLAVLMIVVANLMEAFLLAQMTITGVVFFLLGGWCMDRARRLPKLTLSVKKE